MGIEEFAGGENLKFFRFVPKYVDRKKHKPGFSPLPKPTAWDWVRTALTLRHIWASPNTVWGAIALAVYFLFPYDLSATGKAAAGPLTLPFFAERFGLWFGLTTAYAAFFHVTLYWLGWGERPFLTGRTYNWDKIAHNVFWSSSGIAIWTAFENVFAFLWATGRLPYMSDADAAASGYGALKFAGAFIAIPLIREIHFYFAHRLLHFKPLYYAVHSLHHRNQDIEPFAGLSMHPVEHLYYFACVFPSLLPGCSPFFFLWNGVHLLLSPGASHSGYEDHMQSDAFHYMHHRYLECNYAGFGAAALDVYFDTFVESFAAKKEEPGKMEVYADAKSTLRTAPALDFVLYLASAAACVAVWAYAAAVPNGMATIQALVPGIAVTKFGLAMLAGFGPVAVALPLTFKAGGTPLNLKLSTLVLLSIGSAVCAAPVAYAAYLAL